MNLYLECNMGAAGDMLMAALYELLPEPELFLRKMDSLGLPGIKITPEASVKCGISGTHMRVTAFGAEEAAADEISEHTHSHNHAHTHSREHIHTHAQAHKHDHSHGHEHTHAMSYAELGSLIDTLPLPAKVKADALAVYRLLGEAESEVHGVSVEQVHFHEVGTLDALADVVGVCLLIDMLGVTEISAS
ncbi:MAG: DUF111 family protein, partial [Oscillospiraceae bacterium]|nr:DUF111 family protein [Oscillospiraceae bacterium]